MKTEPRTQCMLIVGAGGHGREIAQTILQAAPDATIGIYDDQEPDRALLDRVRARWLGPAPAEIDAAYIGIGSPAVRAAVAARMPGGPTPLVAPSAVVGDDVEMSEGVIVFALATVTTNIRLGRHVHVGRNCAIGHDSTLGDFSCVMPGAAVGGHVTIGAGTYVGSNASIRQCVTIGKNVTIGMGAVVLEDVPDGVTVVGNPARALEPSGC